MRENPSPSFTPEVSNNFATFDPPPYFATHMPIAPSASIIKHGLSRGSHINRPAWQSNDKRSRLPPISVIFSNLSSPNKNLCLS